MLIRKSCYFYSPCSQIDCSQVMTQFHKKYLISFYNILIFNNTIINYAIQIRFSATWQGISQNKKVLQKQEQNIFKLYPMQGSNRSGLQCLEHPNQEITNYCLHFDCLKPLCPDCVQLHTKYHQKQEIQSWKHCVNKSARNVKTTLDTLRSIHDKNNQYQSIKSIDIVESQNVKRLHQIKDRLLRLVDDVFNIHQQRLRNIIRSQYKVDPPDLTKLKMAIDQLEKVLMKLGHASTVLPALKKSLLLDHESLRNYFSGMDYKSKKSQLTQWYVMQNQDPLKLRAYLQQLVKINSIDYERNQISNYTPDIYSSPLAEQKSGQRQSMHSGQGNSHSSNQLIVINQKNYFNENCPQKNLHFFIPSSRQLKILNVQNAGPVSQWKSIQFKSKQDLPCFFKSIVTPSGDIYLTGGSQQDKRCRQIYRYNFQRNSLDFVCKMNFDRSSHSICYLNECIYLIGGFSKSSGQVTSSCQVFKIDTKSCEVIDSLRAPSANSCAVPFGNNYIFKFGGVLNKISGNNLIQMYNVNVNKWSIVNIDYSKNPNTIYFLSFSAGLQINQRQILVFGGYDNSEIQKPQKTCFCVEVDTTKSIVQIKNYNKHPLPYAEGFWNNNPIIHNGKVYGLQNITDQQDQLTAVADDRRVVVFNGERWL